MAVVKYTPIPWQMDDFDPIKNHIKQFHEKLQEVGLRYIPGETPIDFELLTQPTLVYISNDKSMKNTFNGLDMTFDFYWSGERTGSNVHDTIITSINTPTQTGFDTRSFLLRVDEAGQTPCIYFGFAGYFGTNTGSNKLKIGWNTIRIYRPANDYYLRCYLNGIESNVGGYYDKLRFGDLGHLMFGYSSFGANGLVGCGIKNFKLETF